MEINKNVLDIRKYINLMESISKKIVSENLIKKNVTHESLLVETAETEFGKNLVMAFAGTGERALSVLKNFKFFRDVKSIEEISSKLAKASDAELKGFMQEFAPTLKGSNRTIFFNAIKTPSFTKNMTRAIEISAKNPEVLNKLSQLYRNVGIEGREFAEIVSQSTGKSVKEITDIMNKTINTGKDVSSSVSNTIKGSAPEVKPFVDEASAIKPTENINGLKTAVKSEAAAVSAVEKAGRNIGFYGAKTWDKLKALKSRMSVKQLLLYGLATYGAYKLIKGLFTSDPKTNGVLPSCIANLPDVQFVIGSGDVVVAVLKDGVDTTSNGHGGVQFWPNGRVLTVDGQARGNYYCKGTSGGKETVSASLSEQGTTPIDSTYVAKSQPPITPLGGKYDNIHIDWDGTGTGTKPNTGGGSTGGGSTGVNYRNCNDFPFAFGCINPKIGEIQECLGITPPKGYFGPKTRRTLDAKGYDATTITQETYDTIMSTCGGGSQNTTPVDIDPNTGTQRSVLDKYKYDTKGKLKSAIDLANSSMKPTTPTTGGQSSNLSDDVKFEIDQNINKQNFLGIKTGRFVYKGRDLSPSELAYLNSQMNRKGYRQLKDVDKGPNEKYVFVKK